MKWELVVTNELGTVMPTNWTKGADRLEFVSPYPETRAKLEENIALGKMSRYIEHDDRIVYTPTEVIAHTIYNTKEAAEEMQEFFMWKGSVVSAVIIERPDLPDYVPPSP